jgi:alanyl-tRNA synthetase
MNSSEIRQRFLEFFKKRGHTIIRSASLVTPDERGVTNATLFNTAGMQPLIPYLLGKPYVVNGKEINRLVDVQKCLRTVDIDDIGDKVHATFFEMLGNWSLGDYFKREAIEWSYEFLTNPIDAAEGDRGLGLDPSRLYITVFEGDANALRDDEAADIWREVFKKNKVTGERIFYMPADKNWWEAGDNGPCGPDTEMYYDIGDVFKGKGITREQFLAADEARQVVEVWNDVFMQYKKKDGKIIANLSKPSVDTGAGLERLAMTLQGVDNIYDTDLLKETIKVVDILANVDNLRAKRIIADHIKSSSFLIHDGVTPSNIGRGYVLRKLIRRAVRYSREIGIKGDLTKIAETLIKTYGSLYDLEKSKDKIITGLEEERKKFERALIEGLRMTEKVLGSKTSIDKDKFIALMNHSDRENLLRKSLANHRDNKPFAIKEVSLTEEEIRKGLISGKEAFDIYQSFGMPVEMITELAREKMILIDRHDYRDEVKKHQELSRSGAEQKFKGGLADVNDPMVVRYHTATHLLQQALHDVLGEESGNQKGSNITTERLRYDFTGVKLTDEQKKKVEVIVNEKIKAALPVNQVILSRTEAEKTGARHFFGEKYGDQISIYYIGDSLDKAYSKEFCGGPHVKNTGELAGPEGKWRIKAVLD